MIKDFNRAIVVMTETVILNVFSPTIIRSETSRVGSFDSIEDVIIIQK